MNHPAGPAYLSIFHKAPYKINLSSIHVAESLATPENMLKPSVRTYICTPTERSFTNFNSIPFNSHQRRNAESTHRVLVARSLPPMPALPTFLCTYLVTSSTDPIDDLPGGRSGACRGDSWHGDRGCRWRRVVL